MIYSLWIVLFVFTNCALTATHQSSSIARINTRSARIANATRNSQRRPVRQQRAGADLSLWIDRQQVKMFSGFPMEIYVIANGRVLSYILDPMFEKYLPIIPSEVGYVNFTWRSGEKKYYYRFDRLQSFDEDILEPPTVSVDTHGRIPRKPKVFSVLLPCSGNASGIATFSIGLLIESRKGKPLAGTPLRLRLRKECAERDRPSEAEVRLGASTIPLPHAPAWHPAADTVYGQRASTTSVSRPRSRHGPDPECDKKCANGGWCNHEKICQCPEGYMGQHCRTALCYPQCMNGGSCTSPGMCSCPSGFQGRHCEGGICKEKCLNGGKCIQKDTCDCPKGFYGLRCEFTKCVIPCLNGGRCRGVNKCRCVGAFKGDHCEVTPPAKSTQRNLCQRPCRNGICTGINRCLCHEGWHGKFCHRHGQNATAARSPPQRRKVWV